MDDEIKKDPGEGYPRQWVPREVLVEMFRGLPPDPTLLDEIREGSETLEDLGDPWER